MAIKEGACHIALAFNVRPRSDLDILWLAELPLGCVACPSHPVAKRTEILLNDASKYPIVFQSRALAVRRYLEKHHSWLFASEPQSIVTNSLQPLKKMAIGGHHVVLGMHLPHAFTTRDNGS